MRCFLERPWSFTPGPPQKILVLITTSERFQPSSYWQEWSLFIKMLFLSGFQLSSNEWQAVHHHDIFRRMETPKIWYINSESASTDFHTKHTDGATLEWNTAVTHITHANYLILQIVHCHTFMACPMTRSASPLAYTSALSKLDKESTLSYAITCQCFHHSDWALCNPSHMLHNLVHIAEAPSPFSNPGNRRTLLLTSSHQHHSTWPATLWPTTQQLKIRAS